MKRTTAAAIGIVVILACLVAGSANAGKSPPFHLKLWTETNHGAHRAWLNPECYDDDHTAYGYASGILAAGESWSFTSPRVVCHDMIQRGLLSFHRRLSGHVSLIDYGLHPIAPDYPTDFAASGPNISRAVCNTDLGLVIPGVDIPPGELHVMLDPTGDTGEPMYPATWTVTAERTGDYFLEMILDEPWWQGGESARGYCR